MNRPRIVEILKYRECVTVSAGSARAFCLSKSKSGSGERPRTKTNGGTRREGRNTTAKYERTRLDKALRGERGINGDASKWEAMRVLGMTHCKRATRVRKEESPSRKEEGTQPLVQDELHSKLGLGGKARPGWPRKGIGQELKRHLKGYGVVWRCEKIETSKHFRSGRIDESKKNASTDLRLTSSYYD